jgi:hypothetical protein
MLGRAAERANEAIARGEPHTMLTHHGAEDDSTRIVGRVTRLEQQDDGRVTFEAQIADTAHGRDIAALVTGDQPFLDGVSIRGAWRGPVRRVEHDGQMVETADGLDLFGLDFTKTPGVVGARIEPGASPAETAESGHLVYESVTEATAAATPSRAPDTLLHADPGYLPDKQKRHPLDTARRARTAWSYINEADNSRQYTANQLKRVKGRIKKALRQFGVTVTAETAPLVPPAEDAAWGPVAECLAVDDRGAGFSISAHNGPITVNISAYEGIEPAELEVIAKAAMCAACDALRAMDPDMDADIDVPGVPDADTDGSMEATDRRPDDDQMETAPHYVVAGEECTAEHWDLVRRAGIPTPPGTRLTAAMVNQAIDALVETTPSRPAGDPTPTTEVPAVSESTPAAETANTPAPAVIQLTADQFQQLLGTRPAPAPATESAPAAPAAPVAETEDQRIDRIVAERLATERTAMEESLRAEVRHQGPARKGLRPAGTVAESGYEDPNAVRRAGNDALLSWVSNGRYTNEYDD